MFEILGCSNFRTFTVLYNLSSEIITLLHSFSVLLFFWTFWFVITKWTFSMIIYSGVLFMAIFWHRKSLSNYFLLLNLSNMVRFTQNMTVLQLAVISLILISYCLSNSTLWCWQSLLYYFVQDTKRFYMSMTKVFINDLGCFFLPAVLGNVCIILLLD